MGFLKKAAGAFGHIDKDLIERGVLTRGRVVACKRTGMTTGVQVKCVVCNLTIEVELEDRPLYTATCKHPVPMPYLSQFESGQGYVAVRVDPEDEQNIAIDPGADVPSPRAGVGAGEPPPNRVGELSAEEILATGTPCRVIVQSAQPLGFQKDGKDVWGIVLNALADGEPTTQARIGIGVPTEAMSLLFPGSNLPAKRRNDIQDGVSIDWTAALANAN